jgi:hypothetical protein
VYRQRCPGSVLESLVKKSIVEGRVIPITLEREDEPPKGKPN